MFYLYAHKSIITEISIESTKTKVCNIGQSFDKTGFVC